LRSIGSWFALALGLGVIYREIRILEAAMEFHRGRLFDHVHLVVHDLDASKRFYSAVLKSLGRAVTGEGTGYFFSDELYVSDGEPTTGRVHLAFQAADRATVDRFHRAGLFAGGRDNGPPGERNYHPGYYAAFLLDPDGNNIEAVFHGPAQRSAESVVITAEG
jgi:catechol 2,3-dioxygenase-like lactoylglutathione lyase family enzyme